MLFGPFHSDGVSVKYLDDRFEDFCLRAAANKHLFPPAFAQRAELIKLLTSSIRTAKKTT